MEKQRFQNTNQDTDTVSIHTLRPQGAAAQKEQQSI